MTITNIFAYLSLFSLIPSVEPPEELEGQLLEQMAQKVRDKNVVTKKRLIEMLKDMLDQVATKRPQ